MQITARYTPDAVMVATKTHDLFEDTPLAGMLPPFTETAMIGRDDTTVVIMFAGTPILAGDAAVSVAPDIELAEVEFGNALDAFRRDGWTVREPDPWELDVDGPDAPLPF